MTKKMRRIGEIIAAAAAMSLAITLFRIRRMVLARQREIDANWEEGTREHDTAES